MHADDEFGIDRSRPTGRAASCRRYHREYYATHSKDLRAAENVRQLRRKYGLTPAEIEAMAAEQGGVCAICGAAPRGRWKRLHVDHDHATGAVRALLCNDCNLKIGVLESDWVALAIAYLVVHGSQPWISENVA